MTSGLQGYQYHSITVIYRKSRTTLLQINRSYCSVVTNDLGYYFFIKVKISSFIALNVVTNNPRFRILISNFLKTSTISLKLYKRVPGSSKKKLAATLDDIERWGMTVVTNYPS